MGFDEQFEMDAASLEQMQADEAAGYEAAALHEQEYFQRPISVHCDLCSTTARGTRATLVACGWQFGRGSEFCPAEGN